MIKVIGSNLLLREYTKLLLRTETAHLLKPLFFFLSLSPRACLIFSPSLFTLVSCCFFRCFFPLMCTSILKAVRLRCLTTVGLRDMLLLRQIPGNTEQNRENRKRPVNIIHYRLSLKYFLPFLLYL
jgi:hypothetical protein